LLCSISIFAKIKFTMKNLIVLIITGLMLSLNSFGQLKCHLIDVPEKFIPNAKKVAIMKFQNRRVNNYYYWYRDNYGEQLTDYMTGLLLEEERGKKGNDPVFFEMPTNQVMVIERSQLDAIIKEQQLGASGAIDDNQAAKVGKLLGLDLIVSGSYNYTNNDANSQSTRKNKDGSVRVIRCTERLVNVEATMKIISVETGQIMATITKNKQLKEKKCDAARSKLTPVNTMVLKALKLLATDLVGYFTPNFKYQRLDLEKIKVKDYKQRAKDAYSAAKGGDLATTFGVYKALYEVDNYNPRLAYNLALCYEAGGNFDKALPLYKTALELDDNKQYKTNMERAQAASEFVAEYKTGGFEFKGYDYKSAGTQGLIATEEAMATTKGSKKDRVSVYSDPMKQSDVIAKVPGGTDFKILGTEGKFTKIQLLGGKEGYVSNDDIK